MYLVRLLCAPALPPCTPIHHHVTRLRAALAKCAAPAGRWQAPRLMWGPNKFEHGTLGGVNVAEFGDLAVESPQLQLNLASFSGLIVSGPWRVWQVLLTPCVRVCVRTARCSA
jgi:hypothetical protein